MDKPVIEYSMRTGTLYIDGVPVRIQFKTLTLLHTLNSSPNKFCTLNELHEGLWKDVNVYLFGSLKAQVGKLRKLIGKNSIRTYPRRGYQLTAEARILRNDGLAP